MASAPSNRSCLIVSRIAGSSSFGSYPPRSNAVASVSREPFRRWTCPLFAVSQKMSYGLSMAPISSAIRSFRHEMPVVNTT